MIRWSNGAKRGAGWEWRGREEDKTLLASTCLATHCGGHATCLPNSQPYLLPSLRHRLLTRRPLSLCFTTPVTSLLAPSQKCPLFNSPRHFLRLHQHTFHEFSAGYREAQCTSVLTAITCTIRAPRLHVQRTHIATHIASRMGVWVCSCKGKFSEFLPHFSAL